MTDIALPALTPVFPITKVVRPRQRQAKLPDWGIEQRDTIGQNQTSPEWNVKWILLPTEANILDAFLAERASRGEWFLWTPPGGVEGRYRCDNWTKVLPNCTWREFQATFRQVYSYEVLVSSSSSASDPSFASVSLLLHMDGNNGSTTFTDSSSATRTVTRYGNAQISTAQSKFGGASGYFDGTGDYLAVPANSAFHFGTGDFTVECWVRPQADGTRWIAGIWSYVSPGAQAWALYTDASRWKFVVDPDDYVVNTSTSVPQLNQWTHVACVRQGTKFMMFINGIKESETIVSSFTMNSGSGDLTIGTVASAPSNTFFTGHLDDLRITKGVARYTEDFIVPVAAFPGLSVPLDPSFSSVSLLLHMDGSNGSTTFTDSSSNTLTVTANGNAQISATQSKFGGASGSFDGTGDYLSLTMSGGLGSGDFTIEFWYYKTADSGFLFNSRTSGTGADGVDIRHDLQLTTAGVFIFGGVTVSTNAWHHVAFVRSGSTITRYIDGSADGTATNTTNYNGSALRIGGSEHGNIGYLNGYMDDFRITVGVARYTANFTPPTAAFPNA
jgi:phage-related protein